MLSHSLDRGVLVITVHEDPGVDGRATLVARISGLVQAYRPAPVVIVLDEPAARGPVVSAVLRVHRACGPLGTLLSVATHSAPIRRELEADTGTGGTRLVVHARVDTAVSAAFAAAA
ncbi:hypothetical protein [Streptomyces sp. NPDC007984]|uniref:hypothetical protein n=1 Tax=Streptomyces sp. NPDC007984 TaxID=3364801 RepID=UPI0036F097C6